jgi:hypothetical protein
MDVLFLPTVDRFSQPLALAAGRKQCDFNMTIWMACAKMDYVTRATTHQTLRTSFPLGICHITEFAATTYCNLQSPVAIPVSPPMFASQAFTKIQSCVRAKSQFCDTFRFGHLVRIGCKFPYNLLELMEIEVDVEKYSEEFGGSFEKNEIINPLHQKVCC